MKFVASVPGIAGAAAIALFAALPAAAESAPARAINYPLRQAAIAWDMLSKVASVCTGMGNQNGRLDELESVARRSARRSAKALLRDLANAAPPVLMTPAQAVRVVANAGGCGSPAFGEWRGRAAFMADTTRQALAGNERAERVWPRQVALEQPVRITVAGISRGAPTRPDITDPPVVSDPGTVRLELENRTNAPLRVAFIGPQSFIGLCTALKATGAPMASGYAAAEWLFMPPRGKATVLLHRPASCPLQPRVNVGGAIAVDKGNGPRYWRYLLRGVGPERLAQ